MVLTSQPPSEGTATGRLVQGGNHANWVVVDNGVEELLLDGVAVDKEDLLVDGVIVGDGVVLVVGGLVIDCRQWSLRAEAS